MSDIEEFPEPATVYGLYSTRDGRIRYVGQTTGLPEWRFSGHKAAARKGARGAVNEWMRAEVADGHEVKMRILDEAGTLNETEREYIAILRAAGFELLNVNVGGGGAKAGDKSSKPMNDEHRRKLGAAAKGRRHRPESKAKIGASRRASWRMKADAEGHGGSLKDNPGMGVVLRKSTLA